MHEPTIPFKINVYAKLAHDYDLLVTLAGADPSQDYPLFDVTYFMRSRDLDFNQIIGYYCEALA